MSMITDLIKRLETESDGYKGYHSKRAVRVKHLLREAADTIEQLSAKLQAVNRKTMYSYFDGIAEKMRYATKEERESVNRYINSISVEMIPITVLEDIRAEISYILKHAPYLYDNEHLEELDGMQAGLSKCLKIIDKHDPSKAGKDGNGI